MFWLAALAAPGPGFAAAPAVTEHAVVARVVDGDTVILADGRHLRLVGINTPERGRDGAADEPLYREARDALARLVAGRRVGLAAGPERNDRHGRMLAHLYPPGERSAQEVLLEQGLGFAIAVPPNVRLAQIYAAAEQRARARRLGVWAEPYFAPRRAAALGRSDTGFRLVRGQVRRVGQSRRYVYLDLAPAMSLMIAHADWERYFDGRPQAWKGREIVARGWISGQGGKLRMRIGHPGMIEQIED